MKVFFDVDFTLLCMDGSLRPWAKEVFQWLKRDGHDIYVWSGKGIRKAEMERFQLDEMVTGYFEKPLWDNDLNGSAYLDYYRTRLVVYGIPFHPDFVVDDNPEIVHAFTGLSVRPYMSPDPEDEELLQVYRAILNWAPKKPSY